MIEVCPKCGENMDLAEPPPGYVYTGPEIPPESVRICQDCFDTAVELGELTGVKTGSYEMGH